MKKYIALALSVFMILCVFTGCMGNKTQNGTSNDQNQNTSDVPENITDNKEPLQEEKTTVRLAGMKGPTTMGMVKLLDDSENQKTKNNYDFLLATAADEITPLLIKGELDIAAVPVNLAANLYNKTEGEIQLLAVNTLGVLYIVGKDEDIDSVEDLRGKTIYATGKGTTPEYNLRHILLSNGIDPDKDVDIQFKSEPAEIVALLSKEDSAVAMLPQPFVTVALNSVEDLEIELDITQEWDKLNTGSKLITGVCVVRKEFADANTEAVAKFLEEYKASCEYANSNIEDTALLVEKYGIVKSAVAQKAIPFCNIKFMAGVEMIDPVSGYLTILYEHDNASVGGAVPNSEFFYVAE